MNRDNPEDVLADCLKEECELCGNPEIYEDHLCQDCFTERAQDRKESERDSYD